ncbi:carboxypeptidase-like regulatory domain-containing protein [Luteimonas dalianensis]|uniref:carboxypeptidase-like regulatory domain-containing protein n=1 Tax=Luteimonas dalianensis TaxID=1148196 RepID=UPI003BF12A83
MDRVLRGFGVAALAAALAMTVPAQQADAQVRSASRHAADDQAQALQAQWDRIGAMYDPAQMEASMEMGNGSLRGVMGYSAKSGRSLARLLSRTATAVADREWVFLLPVTPYVQAWYDANEGILEPFYMRRLNPEVWKYAGRVRTDTQGNFEFSGLKPGRYLVFAEFPVIRETEHQEDTGRRSISYSPMFGTGSIDPVYRTVRGTQYTTVMAGQIVTVREGTATNYRPVVE